MKFTPHGEVSIHVSFLAELENQVITKFKVQDTGIGISEDKIENLFSPFSQMDASNTRHFVGHVLVFPSPKTSSNSWAAKLESKARLETVRHSDPRSFLRNRYLLQFE